MAIALVSRAEARYAKHEKRVSTATFMTSKPRTPNINTTNTIRLYYLPLGRDSAKKLVKIGHRLGKSEVEINMYKEIHRRFKVRYKKLKRQIPKEERSRLLAQLQR